MRVFFGQAFPVLIEYQLFQIQFFACRCTIAMFVQTFGSQQPLKFIDFCRKSLPGTFYRELHQIQLICTVQLIRRVYPLLNINCKLFSTSHTQGFLQYSQYYTNTIENQSQVRIEERLKKHFWRGNRQYNTFLPTPTKINSTKGQISLTDIGLEFIFHCHLP